MEALRRWLARLVASKPRDGFGSSAEYWRNRYLRGATSGDGSYRHLAEFKAEVLNGLVREHGISSVIEFGCGDGNQLRYADYPAYLGLDISAVAIRACRRTFRGDPRLRFALLDEYRGERAELALSLDVVYHLVEDAVFADYMQRLFAAATRRVVIYSSDTDDNSGHAAPHLRHRAFSAWVAANVPGWQLEARIPNRFPFDGDPMRSSFADFFIYRPVDPGAPGPG